MKTFLPLLASLALAPSAFASFHLMQIEQVIGAIDSDTTAQAIQLRMRVTDQDMVSATRLRAWDAAGTHPVVVLDITTDVAQGAAGSRILLATPAFVTRVRAVKPGYSPDFTMTRPIPPSYLPAGRLTFETDNGSILWSLTWGGAAYTGSNTGSTSNDFDGDFGPAIGKGIPTVDRRSLRFDGAAGDPSTTNAADYKPSGIPAVVTNNSGISTFIGSLPEIGVAQPVGSYLTDGISKRSFGSVTVGSSGAAKTFTIKNMGHANLILGTISISGLAAADFLVSPPWATTLAPGATAPVSVTFHPTAVGTRNAVLHIHSNDENENPFDIKLTGMGIAP